MDFDFKKSDATYKMSVNESLILYIERMTNSWASLYFTDEMNNRLQIPYEITVYDSVFDTNNSILQLKQSNGGFYCLSWTENYVIKYKGDTILTITNPRVVSFHSYL